MPDGALSEEQIAVAIKDPEHLKRWLRETGREYLLLNALDVVDALWSTPALEQFMLILAAYRDHRRTKPTGWTEKLTGKNLLGVVVTVNAPVMCTDQPEQHEVTAAMPLLQRAVTAIQAERCQRGARRGDL